jgi:lysophospholipase L1-like esterase
VRGRSARVLLLVATLLFSLVAVEQLLRALGFQYRTVSIEVIHQNDARLFHLFDDSHFVYDPVLIWRPKRNYEIFNSQGYRGPELAEVKPPRERRIFTVGDSNTLGWAGVDGPNWPAELGERLRRQDPTIQVMNAGVWGYSSYQGLERLREALAWQPDLVLVSFGANDAHVVPRGDRTFAAESLFTRQSARWLRWVLHFRLGQLAAAAWDGVAQPEGEGRHRVELDEYRSNLSEMIRLGREAGAEVVLLTRPFIGPVRKENWWKQYGPTYNRATVEVGEAEKALVVDIYSFFKDEDRFFSDESHFTLEGHQRAADILATHLRPWARSKRGGGSAVRVGREDAQE